MKKDITISVTAEFEGFHCWPGAPMAVEFLRYPHRHLFKVIASFKVTHADRELEFILVKRRLKALLDGLSSDMRPEMAASLSCEAIGSKLLEELCLIYPAVSSVAVSEDGENWATVSRLP